MYSGIITALTEERRVRPLTSLHQALILSLSTPGSNFTSTPHIPSSLSLSLQGCLSSLSHYFITSSPPSVAILSFYIPLSLNLMLFSTLSLFFSLLFFVLFCPFHLSDSASFHLPKLSAFFFFGST